VLFEGCTVTSIRPHPLADFSLTGHLFKEPRFPTADRAYGERLGESSEVSLLFDQALYIELSHDPALLR